MRKTDHKQIKKHPSTRRLFNWPLDRHIGVSFYRQITWLYAHVDTSRDSTFTNGLQDNYVLVKWKERIWKKLNLLPSLEQSGPYYICLVIVDAVIMQPHL